MSVTGNKGNRRHTTSDSGNDGNKVPNPKCQSPPVGAGTSVLGWGVE